MKILIWPNPILKQVSEPVMDTSTITSEFIGEMFKTMKQAGGVGLSAIQVGVPKRMFVTCVENVHRVFVNPMVVTYMGEEKEVLEGCLSLPGQFDTVKRFTEIEVSYDNIDFPGQRDTTILKGLEAHVFQHEYEHLDGKLFVDKLPSAKRSTIRGNLQKLKKAGKI